MNIIPGGANHAFNELFKKITTFYRNFPTAGTANPINDIRVLPILKTERPADVKEIHGEI
jgi:hypothetical protein